SEREPRSPRENIRLRADLGREREGALGVMREHLREFLTAIADRPLELLGELLVEIGSNGLRQPGVRDIPHQQVLEAIAAGIMALAVLEDQPDPAQGGQRLGNVETGSER